MREIHRRRRRTYTVINQRAHAEGLFWLSKWVHVTVITR